MSSSKLKHQYQNPVFRILAVIAVVSFLFSSFFIYNHIRYKYDVTKKTREDAAFEAKKAAKIFNKSFGELIKITDSVADELASNQLKKDEILERLGDIINHKNSSMYGIGVIYIPYIDDPDIREKSPYYLCKAENKENLDENKFIRLYSAPIYTKDTLTNIRIRQGIVFVDYLISDIKEIVASLNLGKSGYGFLLSGNGTFVAHPVAEYNEEEKTIFKIAEESEDKTLLDVGEAIIRAESGLVEHSNELTGQLSWIFYEPITSISWSFIVVYIKEDILDLQHLRIQLTWIGLFCLVFVIVLGAILSKAYLGTTKSLSIFSLIFTLALILKIIFIWYLVLNFEIRMDTNFVKIVDKTGLDNYVNQYVKKTESRCKEIPYKIPTAILLENLEFPSAKYVVLTGYLWQKYTDGIHDNITRGVLFPQALSRKEEITKSYERKENGYTVYGWYFRITIKQTFDYSKYPLDKKDLLLRIVPKDFAKNIVLVPDLDAYKYINPSLKPGISQKVSVIGWRINRSSFIYKTTNHSSNFGLTNFDCRERSPELYFNVNFRRNFIGSIFSKLMPLLVMLTILFILIVIGTNDIDMVGRMLGPTGAFFFAVILAHVSLRGELAVEDIVYFEYFYILMYAMILFIFLNAVFYSRGNLVWFMRFRQNLISKLLFWPLFFFILLITSIVLLLLK